jgi:sporulation protein YlmC with PRC-barrel domain
MGKPNIVVEFKKGSVEPLIVEGGGSFVKDKNKFKLHEVLPYEDIEKHIASMRAKL